MQKNKHLYRKILLTIIFLIVISSSMAVSPHIQQSIFGTGTLVISVPIFEQIVADKPFQLNAHVYNSSGFLVDNSTTSCRFHLINIFGIHLIEEFMFFDSVANDFNFNITAGNLTKGVYSILINCNNSQAGFFGAEIEVTSDGLPNDIYPSGWLPIIIALSISTIVFVAVSFMIRVKELTGLKIFLFLIGILNAFFLLMTTYFISLNPGRVDTFQPIGLGLISVSGLSMAFVIWLYAAFLIRRNIERRNDERDY